MDKITRKRGRPSRLELGLVAVARLYLLNQLTLNDRLSDKDFAISIGYSPRQFRRLKVKMLESNLLLKQDEVINKSNSIPEVINQEGNSTNADIISDSPTEAEDNSEDETYVEGQVWKWNQ